MAGILSMGVLLSELMVRMLAYLASMALVSDLM